MMMIDRSLSGRFLQVSPVAQNIREIFLRNYPEESVVLYLENDSIVELENIHPQPTSNFRVTSGSFVDTQYTAPIAALIHSHINCWPCPSAYDMQQQIATNIPWGISSILNQNPDQNQDLNQNPDQNPDQNLKVSPLIFFDNRKPSRVMEPPILERPFIHGINDCYSLIRDYYYNEFKITLNEIPRNWEWWAPESSQSESLYIKYFKEQGFQLLDSNTKKQHGDIVVMCIRSHRGPNHAGIYLNEEKILHHLSGNKAVDRGRIPYTSYIGSWHKYITQWARHEQLQNQS